MSMLRKGNPYIAGYAIPQNVFDEPLHRGAIVSKYRKRGTIDGNLGNPRSPGGHPGYILPQSVRDEPLGQGVRTTHYRKRGTISNLVPDEIVTRHKTERIGVGGIFDSRGGIFDSRVKRGNYGSLGQVARTAGPTLATNPTIATALTVKAPTTVATATATPVPVAPVGLDWGRAESFQVALKAATAVVDQVFRVFPTTYFPAQMAEMGVPKTASGQYDVTGARYVMVQALLKQVNPSLYTAFLAEKSMPPAVPTSLRNIKGVWTKVWSGITQPQQPDIWKWRLAIVFDRSARTELESMAAGRVPTGGYGGLGGWTSWVKKRVTWGTVGAIIAGPAGFLIGAAFPSITEKGLKAIGEGIKEGAQKVADIYCEFAKTGIPQQAATIYGTTQGGPQGGEVAGQTAGVLNSMCSPYVSDLPVEAPSSGFPLVPVLIGGGVLLGIILLARGR